MLIFFNKYEAENGLKNIYEYMSIFLNKKTKDFINDDDNEICNDDDEQISKHSTLVQRKKFLKTF